jgi:hypothetical protein
MSFSLADIGQCIKHLLYSQVRGNAFTTGLVNSEDGEVFSDLTSLSLPFY